MSTDNLPQMDLDLGGVFVDASPMTALATTTLDQTRAITVRDTPSYEQAGSTVTGLRALTNQIEQFFDEPVGLAHKAWKALTSKRKGLIDPIEAEVRRLSLEMAKYSAEQDRLARIAREEEQRIAREQEQAALLAEAAGLEHAGLHEDALAMMDEMLSPAPVVIASSAPAVPRVEGISYRETWKHRVVDESRIAREWMCVDEQKIARVVAATKGGVKIPGVEVYCERTPVVRGVTR